MSITRRRFVHRGAAALALAGAGLAPGFRPAEAMGPASSDPKRALIPRTLLFGNPTRASPQISPDGKRIGFIAPVDGVLNVWVAPVDDLQAAVPITRDRRQGIQFALWARTGTHLLYSQDRDGDENDHLYAVPAAGGDPRDLTPFEGARAEIVAVSRMFPSEALVGLNKRDAHWHDVFHLDLISGASRLVEENTTEIAGWVADDHLRLRLATRNTADGGFDFLVPAEGSWKQLVHVEKDDALSTQPAAFGPPDGSLVYLIDTRGRDKAAAATLDLRTGDRTILGEHAKSDVADFVIDPVSHRAQAYSTDYLKPEWIVIDPAVEADFRRLKELDLGEFTLLGRTEDDRKWIVHFASDVLPAAYHLYDRDAGRATFLFSSRPELAGLPLARKRAVVIPSRDGLELVSYLTLPADAAVKADGLPAEKLPMVLLVHGGPWARDEFAYDPYHQLLTDRGYAVLSVNFRGSTGFGKAFVNAGDREWGRKMHDDLIDGVDWAIKAGIADSGRVAIMGGSYGGYAVLAGLTFTPDVFACGIDMFGPSNLETLLAAFPPYWQSFVETLAKRVGDPRTEEGRALLRERSPLHFSDRIRRPLLIAQGANDVRVTRAESDQLVGAMKRNAQPVTYLLYPDEGHGFVRPENRLSFMAVAEAFLAVHLGGRHQGFDGDVGAGSLVVAEGAGQVDGLAEAAAKQGKPAN